MSEKYDFLYTSEKIPKLPHIGRPYALYKLSRAYPWVVWNTSILEGYDFTLGEVETIINGFSVANHPIPPNVPRGAPAFRRGEDFKC